MPSESFDLVKIVFGVLGGLAIFIYGMNLMGDGLQKAAGEKMRRILEVLTSNPLMGVLVGALVTAIIQSSSATTVMVVGFVSAKLMTLPQAIGVIMGANIGTTMTAQLIAFNLGDYAYPIAFIGFAMFFFIKNKSVKYIGQTVFAFGLLFIGLNTMADVMTPLAQNQVFADAITKVSNIPVLGLLVGTAMTVIIQSSSATIGVLQNLASQPIAPGSTDALITLKGAMPVLFGDNIGTTITAVLAAIGAKVNAKRAAVAHSMFNILGAIIFILFIPVYAEFIKAISPKGPEIEVIKRQIANAHTFFNLFNTLLWLPFVGVLAKIVTYVVRGKDDSIEKRVVYLDKRMLGNATVAMNLATKELARMAEMASQMMTSAKNAFVNSDVNEMQKVDEIEETVDMLQNEIIKYLSTMLSQGTLTERQSIRLAGLMHVTNDIERIGDYCQNISESAQIKLNERLPFSQEAIAELTQAFNQLDNMVKNSIQALRDGNLDLARRVLSAEYEVDKLEKSLRSTHMQRLNTGLCNPQSAITFIELIHNLERIGDHCNNIAEAVMEDYNKTEEEV